MVKFLWLAMNATIQSANHVLSMISKKAEHHVCTAALPMMVLITLNFFQSHYDLLFFTSSNVIELESVSCTIQNEV